MNLPVMVLFTRTCYGLSAQIIRGIFIRPGTDTSVRAMGKRNKSEEMLDKRKDLVKGC